MSAKMRTQMWLGGLITLALTGWIGWNALQIMPRAWIAFKNGTTAPPPEIDSTLFESDSIASQNTVSEDSSVTGMLERIGALAHIAKYSAGSALYSGQNIPMYSLSLHEGLPLVTNAALLMDSLQAVGFQILESQERPRSKFPWVARIGRPGETPVVIRAKIDAPPLAGTFDMHLFVWADSLDANLLAAIPKLPSGITLALAPAALQEERLRTLASQSGIRLAVLTRLETTRYPVSRQEPRRLMLHHLEPVVNERLRYPLEPVPSPEGLLVLEGERGAADPGLCERLAKFCQKNSLWLLDASQTAGSCLAEKAMPMGVGIIADAKRPNSGTVGEILNNATLVATQTGDATLVLPFDSLTVDALRRNVPFLLRQGVAIVPPSPLHRRNTPGD